MKLLTLALGALENQVAGPFADRLEEMGVADPEGLRYIKRLRSGNPRTSDVIEAVAKYGDKRERKLIRKAVSRVMEYLCRRDVPGVVHAHPFSSRKVWRLQMWRNGSLGSFPALAYAIALILRRQPLKAGNFPRKALLRVI